MRSSSRSLLFNTLSLVTLLQSGSVVLAAIGPVTDLTISNADVSPDGFTRSASVVNGVIDRTIISGNKGDKFEINVINNLNDGTQFQSTSIHWHGMLQTGSAWADGAAFVTQCPIAKSNSFLYQFTPEFAGTYWYHSHLSTQYCDGVRGPLIIYDPADPHLSLYDVDDDSTVLTLSDWYHTVSPSLGAVPVPDATLINGLGRATGFETNALAVISVEQGKRYRLRVVNAACDPNFNFQIDNHTFTAIEVDGVSHEALETDQVQIFAGQRYSLILEANQSIGSYWIRAEPNVGVNRGFTNGFNSAILRYVGAEEDEPITPQVTATTPLAETALVPLENVAAIGSPTPGGVDIAYNLAIGFNRGSFTLNGVSFTPPTVPVLLQIMSGTQLAADLLPAGSIYELTPGATVELSIPGGAAGAPHPFHLHGHTFQVIRSAGSSVYNYDNPPQRDVVSTGVAGDNVTIRFTADNSGAWFLHCHIDWHLEGGLAVVFAENTTGVSLANPVTDQWNQLCPLFDALSDDDL